MGELFGAPQKKPEGRPEVKVMAVKFSNARIPEKARKELTFVASDGKTELYLTPDGNYALVEGNKCLAAISGECLETIPEGDAKLRMAKELIKNV